MIYRRCNPKTRLCKSNKYVCNCFWRQ